MIRRQLMILVAAWALQVGAHAGEADTAPRRLALLIGNWDYNANGKFDATPDPEFQSDLHNPCRDTELLKNALEKVSFGEVDEVCNVSKTDFEKRTEAFAKKFEKLPPGSMVFIYYSGHGMQQYGYLYSLPVMFRLPERLNGVKANDQIQYMSGNAVNVQAMLGKFSERKDLAIYIALDQCRNEGLQKKDSFNDAVNIMTAGNVMIQYSVTPGELSPDHSLFVKFLASEIERGGEIGRIASRVYARSIDRFRKGKAGTFSYFIAGDDFGVLRSSAMILKSPTANGPTQEYKSQASGKIERRPRVFRNVYDNPSLDILWCEGEGEEKRYATAVELAKSLAGASKQYGVGRVLVKPLPVLANLNDGYNVWRNLMRYDPQEAKERLLLENVATRFPHLALLPQRGIGKGGQPTRNYVSAFICDGFTGH